MIQHKICGQETRATWVVGTTLINLPLGEEEGHHWKMWRAREYNCFSFLRVKNCTKKHFHHSYIWHEITRVKSVLMWFTPASLFPWAGLLEYLSLCIHICNYILKITFIYFIWKKLYCKNKSRILPIFHFWYTESMQLWHSSYGLRYN